MMKHYNFMLTKKLLKNKQILNHFNFFFILIILQIINFLKNNYKEQKK